MDKLREYLLARNLEPEEIIKNVEALGSLLDLANVPEQLIRRVLVAYIVVTTGTDEEVEALFVANHMKEE